MKTYKLEDIFKFACRTEEQGKVFYETTATSAQDKEIKDLFLYLSKAEITHAKTFLKFYNLYSKTHSTFPADERFEELLDVLLRGVLFPDISEMQSILTRENKRLVSILKLAMEVETNTIIFYRNIKEVIRTPEVKEALYIIIKEEEDHLIKLKNLRVDLDPLYAGIKYGKFF
jgi:rubrerythrin